ncbi:MAG TPA: sulfatase-like hydrolase/transferase, partial [Gammaproteobacteria bacterium]|nr:sulfatase-like hydrolase/transferase [Gammaproteobacteria bacterium]
HLTILVPIIKFLLLQISAYMLWIVLIWFMAHTNSEALNKKISAYYLVIFYWLVSTILILSLNRHFYPHSFFSNAIKNEFINTILLVCSLSLFSAGICISYFYCIYAKRFRITACLFVFIAGLLYGVPEFYYTNKQTTASKQPNIIIVGIDSLRPDFVGMSAKNRNIQAPNINAFLKTSVVFNKAYSPLARTYPAWVSILTGKYPIHHHARGNLSSPNQITSEDTLAKRLHNAGYRTIYATDEKRFSNITPQYGFDEIWGPAIGINDFVLGGLSDFPLTNLFINLPAGRLLFPYNYANRAAAITYVPENFLQQVINRLEVQQDRPLFLAIHFCITHWPFTWAKDFQQNDSTLDQRYSTSIEKADQQLGQLLAVLKASGLLDNSLVVLLSDHGTSLGLPNDRLITEKKYCGDQNKLKWLTVNKLNNAKDSDPYRLDTAYGQGTDVLSLKQHHIILAFKQFGRKNFIREINVASTLLDIAPTILDFLNLAPLAKIDGLSLKASLLNKSLNLPVRPIFLETDYSIDALEQSHIDINQVVQRSINLYDIDPLTGYLFVKPKVQQALLDSKQRALLWGDWLLARYPVSLRQIMRRAVQQAWQVNTVEQPAYYVLANLKTGEWAVGLDSALTKKAPTKDLLELFNNFYGSEIKD